MVLPQNQYEFRLFRGGSSDLDRLRERHGLLRAHLLALLVLRRLRGAGLLQLHEERLVRAELVLRDFIKIFIAILSKF